MKVLRLSAFMFSVVSLLPLPVGADTIFACAHNTNGKMRHVSAPGQCHNSEHELSWGDGDGNEARIVSLEARTDELERVIGIINEAPTVNAGFDQSILISSSAFLNGLADDDGFADPLVTNWTKESGPGNAVFTAPSAADSFVSFDQIGAYTLRLTAFDGIVSVFDETLVTVFPVNTPPVVDAGPPQVVQGTFDGFTQSCTTDVQGTANDDDLPEPLVFNWSGIDFDLDPPSGDSPDAVFVNPDALGSAVTINLPLVFASSPFTWTWAVRLSVSDGFHVVEDDVFITCLAPP